MVSKTQQQQLQLQLQLLALCQYNMSMFCVAAAPGPLLGGGGTRAWLTCCCTRELCHPTVAFALCLRCRAGFCLMASESSPTSPQQRWVNSVQSLLSEGPAGGRTWQREHSSTQHTGSYYSGSGGNSNCSSGGNSNCTSGSNCHCSSSGDSSTEGCLGRRLPGCKRPPLPPMSILATSVCMFQHMLAYLMMACCAAAVLLLYCCCSLKWRMKMP